MSLFGDVVGLVSGFISDKKKNKLSKEQLELQRMLVNKQIDVATFIQEMAKTLTGKSYSYKDPFGGGVTYNPETGQYTSTLNPQEKKIQLASYGEELKRMTQDQAIRRAGLEDFEKLRKLSVGETGNAYDDIRAFKRGVGAVDPGVIGNLLRGDRAGAINASYDDTARAAQTLGMRTGSSATTDALAGLARDRSRTLLENMGSPEVEGYKFAQDINNDRAANLYDAYNIFSKEGRQFYDAPFAPSGYEQKAYNRFSDAQKFDLSKFDIAMGGSSNAAAAINNAATGSTNAFNQYMQNRVWNPFGSLATGLDNSLEKAVQSILANMGSAGTGIG